MPCNIAARTPNAIPPSWQQHLPGSAEQHEHAQGAAAKEAKAGPADRGRGGEHGVPADVPDEVQSECHSHRGENGEAPFHVSA